MSILANWCRDVEVSLLRLDTIPPLGNTPEFPWAECTKALKDFFELKDLKIKTGEWRWLLGKELLESFPKSLQAIEVAPHPVDASAFWVMPKESAERLTLKLMTGSSLPEKVPLPESREAFFTFLLLEVCQIASSFPSMKGISPRLVNTGSLPQGKCLAQDITISCEDLHCSARLFLPEECVQKVRKFYPTYKHSPASFEAAEAVPLTLSLEVGKVALTSDELKGLEPGDFIRLDTCNYDPALHEGFCTITCSGETLFKGSVTQNSLTLLGPEKG